MMIHQFTSGLKDRPSPKSGRCFPESRLATSKIFGVVGLSQESRSYYRICCFFSGLSSLPHEHCHLWGIPKIVVPQKTSISGLNIESHVFKEPHGISQYIRIYPHLQIDFQNLTVYRIKCPFIGCVPAMFHCWRVLISRPI